MVGLAKALGTGSSRKDGDARVIPGFEGVWGRDDAGLSASKAPCSKAPGIYGSSCARSSCGARKPMFQLAYPNVAETDRFAPVTVCLELNGCTVVGLIEGTSDIKGLALELEVILDQHTVFEYGGKSRGLQRPIGVEAWRSPNHVIARPFARLSGGVGQRNRLLVQAPKHAVGIGLVVVVVENLATRNPRRRGR